MCSNPVRDGPGAYSVQSKGRVAERVCPTGIKHGSKSDSGKGKG